MNEDAKLSEVRSAEAKSGESKSSLELEQVFNSPILKEAIKQLKVVKMPFFPRGQEDFQLEFPGELDSLNLYLLGPEGWSLLWKEIEEHTLIKRLSLAQNDLGQMNETSWKAFCEGLALNRTLKSLSLSDNHLENLNEKQWNYFNDALQSNHSLADLSLNQNNISLIPDEKTMAAFCKAIFGDHQFSEINLFYLRLHLIQSETHWRIFCEAYARNTSLKSVHFIENGLGLLNDKYWELFCKAMSTKSHLMIGNNKLECLEGSKNWERFCRMISESPNLTTLDLYNSRRGLEKISEKGWELFSAALAKSTTLENINLKFCMMSTLSGKSWELFCLGLQQNKSIKSLDIGEAIDHTLGARDEKGWKQFLQVAIWNESLLHVHCQESHRLHTPKIRVQNQEGVQRMYKIQTILTDKKRRRHGRALALAHSLRNLKIKDNRMHATLPSPIAKRILTFFETKPLCDQVFIEVETHVDKKAEEFSKKELGRLKNIKKDLQKIKGLFKR